MTMVEGGLIPVGDSAEKTWGNTAFQMLRKALRGSYLAYSKLWHLSPAVTIRSSSFPIISLSNHSHTIINNQDQLLP